MTLLEVAQRLQRAADLICCGLIGGYTAEVDEGCASTLIAGDIQRGLSMWQKTRPHMMRALLEFHEGLRISPPAELRAHFAELARALRDLDLVTIADLLEYELVPLLVACAAESMAA